MKELNIEISKSQKVYFASDFHLGLPAFSRDQEIEREKKIIRWLNLVSKDAKVIFLVGDVFDFWFEYKHTVPKGYVRFLAKLAEIKESGIPIILFSGNHDLWYKDYLTQEVGAQVYHNPISINVNNQSFYIGHGDGLGPGDHLYKLLKKAVFTNRFAKWIFRWLHPDIGMGIARRWSKASRLSKQEEDGVFLGDKEFLVQYCKEIEQKTHYDYYVFGHRHLPLEIDINDRSKYFNLGEWVKSFTYGEFDGQKFQLKSFKQDPCKS